MPEVIQTIVYTLDELDSHAKERARDWYRQASNDVIRQVDDALLIETLGLRKRDVRALEDARMMMFERRSARK